MCVYTYIYIYIYIYIYVAYLFNTYISNDNNSCEPNNWSETSLAVSWRWEGDLRPRADKQYLCVPPANLETAFSWTRHSYLLAARIICLNESLETMCSLSKCVRITHSSHIKIQASGEAVGLFVFYPDHLEAFLGYRGPLRFLFILYPGNNPKHGHTKSNLNRISREHDGRLTTG